MPIVTVWLLAGVLMGAPALESESPDSSDVVSSSQVARQGPGQANGPGQGQGQGRVGGGQRGRQGTPPAAGGNLSIQELQQYFDAFALVQAQRALGLSDADYGRFFPRMSRLYQLRRQQNARRRRALNELRRLNTAQTADAQLMEALTQLDELEAEFVVQLQAARQAVDEVLTVRQRAGLRFFEEDMERQKIQFMTRARQGGG